MKRVLLLLIMGMGMIQQLKAQDPTFTQYWANPIYLNPAFAGANGVMRVTMAHRNQWSYVPGQYVTNTASIDMKSCNFPNVGLGLIAMQDNEGQGMLKTTMAGFIFNYMIQAPGRYQISMAIQPSVISKSVNWDKLIFSDQLDPVFGNVRPTAAEKPPSDGVTFTDFSAGFMWRFFSSVKHRDDLYSNVGVAINHIFEPNESLLLQDSKLPLRLTVHGGTMITISNYKAKKKMVAVPNMKLEFQRFVDEGLFKNISEFDAGIFVLRQPVIMGLNYRANTNWNFKNGKSLSVILGLKGIFANSFNYMLAYSYDINVAGMDHQNIGTQELTLSLMFDQICFFGIKGHTKWGRRGPAKCFDYEKKGLIPIF